MEVEVTPWTIFVGLWVYFVVMVFIPACFGIGMGGRKIYISVLSRLFEFGRSGTTTAGYKSPLATPTTEKDLNFPPTTLQRRDSTTLVRNRSFNSFRRQFHLVDVCEFASNAVESIIDDEVTKGFSAEQVANWNLLWRTKGYHFISWRLTCVYLLGVVVRYFILLPMRLICISASLTWLVLVMFVFSVLPQFRYRRAIENWSTTVAHRLFCRGLTAEIRYHDKQNAALPGGVCVANHTSPIDVVVLSSEVPCSLVGQRHGGAMGMLQNALCMAQNHVWFERSLVNDRAAVGKRLRDHLSDKRNNPILIFPEGTCINNTKVYQFKKGSFELNAPIYPVAIKYDPQFADAFWNSSKEGIETYLFRLLTSWALVADVWYLDPTEIRENESGADFSLRVKRNICQKGGLVEIGYDGMIGREMRKDMID
eukprot:scpid84521/ scgid25094/ Glycerol-3-phosphate acyltransferase 4; 1-acylglycerol-3-phosphate O-acyltransferase 6; Acyl-CoA:glycerol-3-phosphate acyltransferase 4; Lysophosphatidic acid acyltransferase zeta